MSSDNNEDKGREKELDIIVNARQIHTSARELSFDEIVALAFDNPPTGPNILFTVTFRRGEGNKPEGTLIKGETVKIKDGMIFNVTATDKS